MKSNLKLFLMTLVIGLLTGTSANAQSNPPATFSSDKGIVLSSQHPLSETYDIDISKQGWTKAQAKEALVYLEDQTEVIGLELDYTNKKLILTLELDAREAKGWDFKKWSEHLATIK